MNQFDILIEEFGEPKKGRIMSRQESAAYKGRVPNALIEFWVQDGFGCFQKGRDWVCDPQMFESVIEKVFSGDEFFDPKLLYAVQRQAFANLTLWSHQIEGPVTVDFNFGLINAAEKDSWIDPSRGIRYGSDFIIQRLFSDAKYNEGFVDEQTGEDMFPSALDRHGPLENDEVYGFFPALQLGGSGRIENIQKVKVAAHLLTLCEMTRFKLVRLTFEDGNPLSARPQIIRYVGRGLA